jgi:hypothetical protein
VIAADGGPALTQSTICTSLNRLKSVTLILRKSSTFLFDNANRGGF